MNVLMVTPHLPPHQAANALLPHLLGEALDRRGHAVEFLTFGDGPDTDGVHFVRRGSRRLRATRMPQALEALRTAAGEGIQLHGGIGFTWEHEAHLYFKRATGDELFFGPAHRLRAHAADAARLFEKAEVSV